MADEPDEQLTLRELMDRAIAAQGKTTPEEVRAKEAAALEPEELEELPVQTALMAPCSECDDMRTIIRDGRIAPCPACSGGGTGQSPTSPPVATGGADDRDKGDRDLAAGKAAGEEGMARAARAQRVQAWKRAADAWLEELPGQVEFGADELTLVVGLPDPSEPGKNNVLGGWFSGKAKTEKIVFTGKYKASERVCRHGNLDRIWRKV